MAVAFHADAVEGTVGLHLPNGISARLIAATLSKRFTILTGLAGSGKTKLAQALADWFEAEAAEKPRTLVVPVGADWTNREPLFGYPDALTPGEYRLPASGALQFMMRAARDPVNPYFIILDEMNLSHVERYFADVLSSMESDQPIPLHESRDYEGRDWNGVPHEMKLPPNFFVIGTVNVDETTYMFSPKVLDRANVIEFTVSQTELADFLDNLAPVDLSQLAGGGVAYSQAFVEQAGRRDVSLDELGGTVKQDVKNALEGLFAALAPVGAEFGYRPAYEISRFIYFHAKVSGEGWKLDDALDAAVMQKLLPKLHGSKTKLGPVLAELKKVCVKEKYPLSTAKIERMELRLKQNGFTSYAEA
jgi:5-methylcytosine-specific restriction protein B